MSDDATTFAFHPPMSRIGDAEGHPRNTGRRSSETTRDQSLPCDFLVSVTARFRVLYVLVVMEVGTRKILHCNVTAHPNATWTLQQFREAIPGDHQWTFLIHDRDSIFSSDLDRELESFGFRVLRTPVRAPQANAYCERLVGTLRRECLDFLIPLSESHLRGTLLGILKCCLLAVPKRLRGPRS